MPQTGEVIPQKQGMLTGDGALFETDAGAHRHGSKQKWPRWGERGHGEYFVV
jgi:hypothetical protein